VFEQLNPPPDAPVIVPFVSRKFTVGLLAASGPVGLLIVAVKVTADPAGAVAGPLTPMLRSAAGLTVTLNVELSFAVFGSLGVDDVRVAVFVIVPALLAFTSIVMKTFWPLGRAGIVQLTGPVPTQLPPGTLADTKVAFVNESEMTMLDAADGPALPTLIVNVAF
jgi:hypothetical protein